MLTTIKIVTYISVHSNQELKAEMNNGVCRIKNKEDQELILNAICVENTLKLKVVVNDNLKNDDLLLVAVEYILGHNPDLLSVEISNLKNDVTSEDLLQKYFGAKELIKFKRTQFFQLRGLWHKDRDYVLGIEEWMTTNERVHPVRPDIRSGLLYSRYIPEIEKTLGFRMIDPVLDLDIFHKWHNQPRVAKFWELPLPKEELLAYIEKGLNDPHTLPMVALCDGAPVGYFEMYWTREDRLAPYYESESFDRGFHFLVGEISFLGSKNTDAILKSLGHFLFIDEIRTRKLMAEPRADNTMVLKYIQTLFGWTKLYEFDFPHKRAALLECKREEFFMDGNL